MDYFQDAFGDFNPHQDQHAAVKFALCITFLDKRFDELSCVLIDGHEIGGMEGEPGWIIERRDTGPSGDMPGYADWPAGAHFHVYVDPDVFELAYPELFMTTDEFHGYVHKLAETYHAKDASCATALSLMLSKLEQSSGLRGI